VINYAKQVENEKKERSYNVKFVKQERITECMTEKASAAK
jgi:hypothetical protein